MTDLSRCIHPVILSVPNQYRVQRGRQRVKLLSKLARQALEICAQKSQVQLRELVKDDRGVPQPFNNHYWSLTHKPKYVAAVISLQRTGIDVEEIKPISNAMFKRIATDSEWQLSADRSENLFFRYWTAKEAVLKAEGLGIAGLSTCTINRINDQQHLEVACRGRRYLMEHHYFDGHIASLVKNHLESRWTIQQALMVWGITD